MGQARNGRVFLLIEGILEFITRRVLLLKRRRHRLQTDWILGVFGVDQGEIIGRDSGFVFELKLGDGQEFFRTEGQKVPKLADGTKRVLRLPAPIIPEMVGDIFPYRMATGLTGGVLNLGWVEVPLSGIPIRRLVRERKALSSIAHKRKSLRKCRGKRRLSGPSFPGMRWRRAVCPETEARTKEKRRRVDRLSC